MKKVLLLLMICSIIVVSGCGKKQPENQLPKSNQTYQQLNLTPEQNKKLADIRNTQRKKMDAIRSDIEAKRKDLLDAEKNKKLSDEQKRANQEKYRTAANEMRVKIAAERVEYDNALMGILDDKQKQIYKKYMTQREKEKAQRTKEFQKKMK